MNRNLIRDYIGSMPVKVVASLDLDQEKLEYDKIVQCQKRTEAKSEELCRAYLLTRLVNELGYPPERIEIEHVYTAGRPHTNTSRIDLVVRDSGGGAFLFSEIKKPDEYAEMDQDRVIEEQLFKVAAMERGEGRSVKYLMLYTINDAGGAISDECIIIDYEKYSSFSAWEAARDYSNTIPAHYGRAQKTPYVKASPKDLRTDFTDNMLERLRTDLHNVLWGGGGTDDNEVFSSLTNLILAKVQDEDEREEGETYEFQSMAYAKSGDEEFETNEQLFDRINQLYRRALTDKLYISDREELQKSYVVDTKKFSLSKLKYAVQRLEGLSFVDGKNSVAGRDILGGFFEGIIRDGFKQTKGQFFTHVNIVRFMLYALQADRLAIQRIKRDRELPYMIDPSAGSGTYLVEYMKFITENMKYRDRNGGGYNAALGTAEAVKRKIQECFYPDELENRWAQTYIYGIEINFNLGTTAKVNMILHGDGSSNIFVKDGLLPFSRYVKVNGPSALNAEAADLLYKSGGRALSVNGQFDLILTNPPFSVELDRDTKKTVGNDFLFGEKRNSENLFVERWYQLLRENGRVAAVLPESVFDTTENKYIRLFLYKYFKVKAVVSLPQLAFEPYTSTKTSILFAQKKTKREVEAWNTAWDQAGKEWSRLKTRVENLIAVHDGLKQKAGLPSIRSLTAQEEADVLRRMLKAYVTERDDGCPVDELIVRYRPELEALCAADRDTRDTFGVVNTWWVFSEVINASGGSIFLAEVDSIGYKRSKRGEKETPNELYREKDGVPVIDDGVSDSVLDEIRRINWD